MEQIQEVLSARLRHSPFRSAFAPELMWGVVDIAFENLTSAIPLVKDQRLKALAVAYDRASAMPAVLALSESITPGF